MVSSGGWLFEGLRLFEMVSNGSRDYVYSSARDYAGERDILEGAVVIK